MKDPKILLSPYWLILPGFHLLLMALGASSIDVGDWGIAGKFLDFYGNISGTNSSYAFFAPGISEQRRVRFEIAGPHQKTQTVKLELGTSHEADIRVGNIIDQISNAEVEDQANYRRSMLASLAGTILARYPNTQRVKVRLENFEPVSMEQYRQGVRPHWEEIYEAEFELN